MTAPRLVIWPALAAVGAFVVWAAWPGPQSQVLGDPPTNESVPLAPARGGVDVGMTLFPARVSADETLRFLVDGAVLIRPEVGADTVRPFERGDSVTVTGEVEADGRRWVTLPGGFVAAALLDRIPEAVTGTLPEGREGLVAGGILPWSYVPNDLDTVPAELLPSGSDRLILLRGPALDAFRRMARAAEVAGVEITVVSGFRSATYQAGLFQRQVGRRGFFQNVSAPPGRSEHQLGTTLDVTAPGAPTLEQGFGETTAGRWLVENSEQWGFVISFSRERHQARRVSYEPWHIRWVGANLGDESTW